MNHLKLIKEDKDKGIYIHDLTEVTPKVLKLIGKCSGFTSASPGVINQDVSICYWCFKDISACIVQKCR